MGMKDLWKSQTLQTVKTTIKFFLGAYVFLGQEIESQKRCSESQTSRDFKSPRMFIFNVFVSATDGGPSSVL